MTFAVIYMIFVKSHQLKQINHNYLLLLVWILFIFVIEIWILFVGVVERPFDKMIGQIKSTIVIRAVFKIDDH